jgi:hypothetical protein
MPNSEAHVYGSTLVLTISIPTGFICHSAYHLRDNIVD